MECEPCWVFAGLDTRDMPKCLRRQSMDALEMEAFSDRIHVRGWSTGRTGQAFFRRQQRVMAALSWLDSWRLMMKKEQNRDPIVRLFGGEGLGSKRLRRLSLCCD